MIYHLAHSESIKRMITKHDKAGTKAHLSGTSMFGIINESSADNAAAPKLVVKS